MACDTCPLFSHFTSHHVFGVWWFVLYLVWFVFMFSDVGSSLCWFALVTVMVDVISMSVSTIAAIRFGSFSSLSLLLGCLLRSAWIIISCGAGRPLVLSIMRSVRALITIVVAMMPENRGKQSVI
jgi:hypothetical protein